MYLNKIFNFIFVGYIRKKYKRDWGLGIGDWGLGIGTNPQSPIPNPQSPIPMINSVFFIIIQNFFDKNNIK